MGSESFLGEGLEILGDCVACEEESGGLELVLLGLRGGKPDRIKGEKVQEGFEGLGRLGGGGVKSAKKRWK